MFWPFSRKKSQQKPKPSAIISAKKVPGKTRSYQLSEFSKRRVVNGRTELYHDNSGMWFCWHYVMSNTYDGDKCCDNESITKLPQDLSVSDRLSDSSITSSASSSSDLSPSSYSSSSSSSDWGSSSSSSSSYDSGSSGGGFD